MGGIHQEQTPRELGSDTCDKSCSYACSIPCDLIEQPSELQGRIIR